MKSVYKVSGARWVGRLASSNILNLTGWMTFRKNIFSLLSLEIIKFAILNVGAESRDHITDDYCGEREVCPGIMKSLQHSAQLHLTVMTFGHRRQNPMLHRKTIPIILSLKYGGTIECIMDRMIKYCNCYLLSDIHRKKLTWNFSLNQMYLYRPQGKTMFSHASVILFTIGLMDTWSLLFLIGYSVTAHPYRLLGHSLLRRGRYASYWNAFLLVTYFQFDDDDDIVLFLSIKFDLDLPVL